MPTIVDLTLTLAPGVGHPMFRKVHLASFHVHAVHRRSNADLSMALHTATHIDAPWHFVPDGTTIDRVRLDTLIGPATVFRVASIATPGHRFSVADLEKSTATPSAAMRGMIAVVATGWSNAMFSTDESRYFSESPTLSAEAASWLVETGVKTVVLDCATDAPEPVPVVDQVLPVHHAFLAAGVPIVENCLDLVALPDRPVTVYAIPLKIKDESGAPARVFALVKS